MGVQLLRCAALGMTLLFFGAVILLTDPVKLIVEWQISLTPGTLLYKLWLHPPLEVFIMVYMFNYTNVDAFIDGTDAKMKITEVGPYVYREVLTNNNVTLNEANNTISYTPRRIYEFVPERSVGDPKVDRIRAPNIPYMGLFREGNETNVFNMNLPEPKDAQGNRQAGTPRGYSINSINGEQGFSRWEYDASTNGTMCNRIWGSHDATLFPRDMNAQDTFYIYRRTFCRRLPMKFNRTLDFKGLDAFEFVMEPHIFDSELHNDNTSCFCKNNQCLKKGVGNVSPCYYNMPLAITYPHFMHADPSLLQPFEGLSPNISRHTSTFMLQPQLGVPLHVHMRLQANQVVGNIKFNRLMEPFENLVLPLLWVDLTIDNLPLSLQWLSRGLKTGFPLLQSALALLMLLGGLYQLSAALLLCFWSPPGGKSKTELASEKPTANVLAGLSLVAALHKAEPTLPEEQQLLAAHQKKSLV
ncbi:CG10345 [Drosophila busckii]|uniref:CG10345 n=1 Tax=Drosophila busckii TaxID=30019 RepID=A0A0M5JC85_DROBS|nr:CG10345 [Drosophila busckii]